MFSGIVARPLNTGMGMIWVSLTMTWPPGLRNSRLRRASIVSNEISRSAQPGSHTIVETFSPKRTVVETEPPRWAMP